MEFLPCCCLVVPSKETRLRRVNKPEELEYAPLEHVVVDSKRTTMGVILDVLTSTEYLIGFFVREAIYKAKFVLFNVEIIEGRAERAAAFLSEKLTATNKIFFFRVIKTKIDHHGVTELHGILFESRKGSSASMNDQIIEQRIGTGPTMTINTNFRSRIRDCTQNDFATIYIGPGPLRGGGRRNQDARA
jgi:hypothetical protein